MSAFNVRPRITFDPDLGKMVVRFDYNKQLVALVAGVDRRCQWDGERKAWLFPAEPITVKNVVDMLGVNRDHLPEELTRLLNPPPRRPDVDLSIIGCYQFLRPPLEHQIPGFAELLHFPRWLLAWEQGCGKTFPVVNRIRYGIMAAQFRGPVLIFAPSNVAQSVWPKELREWGEIDCVLLLGTKVKRLKLLRGAYENWKAGGKLPVFVTNYEAVRVIWQQLRAVAPDVVIADECQALKNSASQQSTRARLIAQESRYRWAMSGTPAPNGPLDIFGTLVFLDPLAAGTESKVLFEERYAIRRPIKEGDMRKVILGYRELDDLQARVARVCSRLKKKDCLDLPPKTIQPRIIELSDAHWKIYNDLRNKAVAELRSRRGEGTLTIQNILAESLRLLQVVGGFVPDDDGRMHPLEPNSKLQALEELLSETDGKVIIWANFVAEIDAIRELLGDRDAVYYSGKSNSEERARAIEEFQFGTATRFVGTPAAGGTGLTLTASSTSIYYSRGWNLTHWLQSQDRNHRIGTLWPVTIYPLIARGTVDEKVGYALAAKENLQEMLLNSRDLDAAIEALI